jgi:hypothetical protein
MSERSERREYALVDGDRLPAGAYPYLFVNADGSVRELHPKEREYLETPFHPADGARPYIKESYESKNVSGEITGYLMRSKLPEGTTIHAAPEEDPFPPLTWEDQNEWYRNRGWKVVENSDGSTTLKNPNR